MTKTPAQLDAEIAGFLAVPGAPKLKAGDVAKLIAKRDAVKAREINSILRAADGRNVYLIRHRLGDETVHRVAQARIKARIMEVRDLATGRWISVMPELGDKLEVR